MLGAMKAMAGSAIIQNVRNNGTKHGAEDARGVVDVGGKRALVSGVGQALGKVCLICQAEARADPMDRGEEPTACGPGQGNLFPIRPAAVGDLTDALQGCARGACKQVYDGEREGEKNRGSEGEIEEIGHDGRLHLDIDDPANDEPSNNDKGRAGIEQLLPDGIVKERF